jgi:hypothetical protein
MSPVTRPSPLMKNGVALDWPGTMPRSSETGGAAADIVETKIDNTATHDPISLRMVLLALIRLRQSGG